MKNKWNFKLKSLSEIVEGNYNQQSALKLHVAESLASMDRMKA